MSKDTIKVNMNVYDIPIVVEQLKKLEQENKQLKGILQEIYERAINTNITSLDFRDYILEILGDKEIEEIPLFEGTLEQLNNLSIIGDKENE
ncbi:MAG: hypothetical protein J6S85_04640 [Methanobrevibacter sp.]|nr:hypothetical protein [Methanobrevibacter sp.]